MRNLHPTAQVRGLNSGKHRGIHGPMSRANIGIRAKISSPVKDGIWISAPSTLLRTGFAGMTFFSIDSSTPLRCARNDGEMRFFAALRMTRVWIPAFAGMTIGGASPTLQYFTFPENPAPIYGSGLIRAGGRKRKKNFSRRHPRPEDSAPNLRQGCFFIDSRGVGISAELQY